MPDLMIRDGRSWIRVTGSPADALRATLERLYPGVEAALQAGMDRAIAAARPTLPTRTGAYAASLGTVTRVTATQIRIVGQVDVSYGRYVRFSKWTTAEIDAAVARSSRPARTRRRMEHVHGHGAPTVELQGAGGLTPLKQALDAGRSTITKDVLQAMKEAARG